MQKDTVLVLSINHEYGFNMFVCEDQYVTDKELARYCRTWWSKHITIEDCPKDDQDVIQKYFDLYTKESYSLSYCKIHRSKKTRKKNSNEKGKTTKAIMSM